MDMEFNWTSQFSQLETLVRDGDHQAGLKILEGFNLRKIPREWAWQFAALTFRMHLPLQTLEILHPIILPKNSLSEPANDKEKMIYATGLFSLGAVIEAAEILNKLDSSKEPEVLYYQAIVHFYDWNYAESIPLLIRFVESTKISSYRRLVGKVNLAAAYIYVQDWESASPILQEIKSECQANGHNLLLGNCHELLGQAELFQGRFDTALELLGTAKQLLDACGGIYGMYVEKWILVGRALKSRHANDVSSLRELKLRAIDLKHFETVRDCDLFEAVVNPDEALTRKLIMGSPSELYRQRVRKLTGTDIRHRGTYELQIGPEESPCNPRQTFDPYKKIGNTNALFRRPQLLALFEALTQDFYKPAHLGQIFQMVYPGEKLNPFSSPPRVMLGLKRLNQWFIDNGMPIRVRIQKSEFQLESLAPMSLIISRGRARSRLDGHLLEIQSSFESRPFSSAQLADSLKVSKISALRLIKRLLSGGKIAKVGAGRSQAYRILSPLGERRVS